MKKRNYKRKRKRYSRGYKLTLNKSPMPIKFTTVLRYNDQLTVTGSTGFAGVKVFSANGLYDPNITDSGHQPRGFDEIMPLYDHFVVSACKVKVEYTNTETATPVTAFIAVRDDSAVETAPNNYYEHEGCKTYPLGIANGNSTHVLSHYCNIKSFLGRGNVMSDPELKGSAAANPTEQAFFHIGVAATNQSSSVSTRINVFLEYIVTFIEPKRSIGQS